MRRLLLFASLAAVAGGCQPTVPDAKVDTVKTPEPAKTTPVAETKPAVSSPDPAKQTEKPGTNPKRIYQLADLKKTTVKINGKSISSWVMADEGKRQEGMMWLTDKEVKDDEGMLFVFPSVQPVENGFWMQNTVLPLDIMYFTDKGKLVTIQPGKPFDETSLKPSGPYKFVVEMKQGSAKRLGFHVGSELDVPTDAKAAQ